MLKFTSLPVLTLNGCSNFSTIVIIMKISIPEKSKVEVSDHSDHLEEGGQPKLICNRWSREEFIYQLCFWVIAATSMTILFVLGPMIVLSPETKSINPWSWIYQNVLMIIQIVMLRKKILAATVTFWTRFLLPSMLRIQPRRIELQTLKFAIAHSQLKS